MAAMSAADIDRPCQLIVGGCWPAAEGRAVIDAAAVLDAVIGRCG
jgi:hypothetical protein